MLFPFIQTRLEWRRVAVYQAVSVAGTKLVNEDGSERQQILQSCQPGMRVVLRREPTPQDPNFVALFVSDERQIGQLSSDDAEWIAPLLDSGRVAFDAEIWSLEKVAGSRSSSTLVCQLMLTQHELVPIKRFSLTAWLRRDRRAAASKAADSLRTVAPSSPDSMRRA
jgi:HIRAN domain